MSTEVALNTGTSLESKIKYAQALASSSLLPKQYQKQPANLLFALEYADALGVSPIHAITSIHVIEGKPSASADLIAALIRKAGHKLRVTGDDTQARAVLIRHDDPEFEFVAEWTMAKARAANLTGKGVWKSYPGAMLRSRAITEVARMGAPDALYGVIYTAEELGADVNADGDPVEVSVPTAPVQHVTRQRKPVETTPDDEVVDEAPTETVQAATNEQVETLAEALTQAGHDTVEAKLFALSEMVGRDINNPHNLTYEEAAKILDEMVGAS